MDVFGQVIPFNGLSRRIERIRTSFNDPVMLREKAKKAQALAGDTIETLTNQQSFESVAKRIQKFADAGLKPSDANRFGVKLDDAHYEDEDILSDEAKFSILLKAASSLVTQGAPPPDAALSLIYGQD